MNHLNFPHKDKRFFSRSLLSRLQKSILFIIFSYVTLASLWIFLSDKLLLRFTQNPHLVLEWSIYKGLFFIAVTATLLYGLISGMILKLQRTRNVLLEKTEELNHYFTNSLDVLGIMENDGTLRRLNPGWKNFLGYTLSDPDLVNFFDLVHPEDLEHDILKLSVLRSRNKVIDFVDRYKHKNGTYRWMEWRAVSAARLIYISGRDITQSRQTEQALRLSLDEKETLLHELNHRVNNNLQLISNLMDLQRRHAGERMARDLIEESHNRIRSIALVHEKLYLKKGVSAIDLRDYITELTQTLFQSFKAPDRGISLKTNIENITLEIERAITCVLIINEIVTNSLKHAFSEGHEGEIRVSLHTSLSDTVVLTVSDNGKGLPKGFNLRKADTLGMQLIVGLAEKQLDGEILLDSTEGTSFRISFPNKIQEGQDIKGGERWFKVS